jgi:glutamate-1-semialdehyde 2,1-aminomutase
VDGNEFIDFHSSFGAVLLGHNDARINEAARRAMDEHGVSFSTANPLEVELAERLVEMVPSAERAVFSCTGTEADVPCHPTRSGLHRTRTNPQVRRQLSRLARLRRVEPSLSRPTTRTSRRPWPPRPASRPRCRDLVRVREYNDAAGVRETLRREGDSIAAVILEPVFHNAGVVLPEPGFLETLREACTEAGTC